MMWCCAGSYVVVVDAEHERQVGIVAGAEITTFFAPASMCFCASSRFVKKPVDSSTTSTPRSPHGSAAGSRSASILISTSPALIIAVLRLHVLAERAEHRVVLEQVRHRLRVAEVVRRDDLEVAAALQVRTEEVAPDAPETVDAHPYLCHLDSPVVSGFVPSLALRAVRGTP